MRRIAILTLVALLSSVPSAAGAQDAEPIALRVMTFNIWYGATQTHGLEEVVQAVRRADADVVGMQEPYARLRRVASELGFHASPRMHVISRFPILEPVGSNGHWAYLLLEPGRVAAIANTHLPCCPYTPYRIVNRGFDRASALEQERNTRLRVITSHLTELDDLLASGVPTFFTGDFNAPSHRDWTAGAVASRGLPYTVRWPVSLAMETAGFVDSFRAVHPDPVDDPGFTWTPGYPTPFVYGWEVHDRIDIVWAAGPAVAEASAVVGESARDADIVVTPWPSDHRAVVSTFAVTASPAPTFVAAEGERARLGLPLRARFHGPATPDARVILVPTGSDVPIDEISTGGEPDGTVAFDSASLAQGSYDVVLATDQEELARDTVVLVAEGQRPVVSIADDTLEGDQKLEIAWSYAPGNRFDWFGVYRAGVDPKIGFNRTWRYLDARVDGNTTIGPGAPGPAAWPLTPGRYELRLCLDDSYRCPVSSPFRVLG
jgi:endonuclease/exonuclease/phosphatase family metal-dependent hydrolase